MNKYHDLNNPFPDNSELDKMARQINNNKKNMYSEAVNNRSSYENNTCTGIECLMDPAYSKFTPPELGANIEYGEINTLLPKSLKKIDMNGTKISDLHKHKNPTDDDTSTLGSDSVFTDSDTTNIIKTHKKRRANKANKYHLSDNNLSSDDSTLDTYTFQKSLLSDTTDFKSSSPNPFSENDFALTMASDSMSDLSSNYTSLSPKQKKQFKRNSSHIKKYKNDDKRIMDHTSNCAQCQDLLSKMVNSMVDNKIKNQYNQTTHDNYNAHNNAHNNSNNDSHNNDDSHDIHIANSSTSISKPGLFNINTPELKDLLILILIGIFIIVFVDMFMKK